MPSNIAIKCATGRKVGTWVTATDIDDAAREIARPLVEAVLAYPKGYADAKIRRWIRSIETKALKLKG